MAIYNLRDRQKELVRVLVDLEREGKLKGPYLVVLALGASPEIVGLDGGSLTWPGDAEGDLNALCDEDLLGQRLNRQGNTLYSLRGAAYDAVDSDFSVPKGQPVSAAPSSIARSRVFIVHGHDNEAKALAARCVERLGLQPIILHEQANRGRTVIEKFEDYADVKFAIVLLTPDDVIAVKSEEDKLESRARQNVILELGYFIGKLGREHVCALRKGEVDLPSDIHGIVWTPMDEGGAWQWKLAGEMKAAGLDVDANRLL